MEWHLSFNVYFYLRVCLSASTNGHHLVGKCFIKSYTSTNFMPKHHGLVWSGFLKLNCTTFNSIIGGHRTPNWVQVFYCFANRMYFVFDYIVLWSTAHNWTLTIGKAIGRSQPKINRLWLYTLFFKWWFRFPLHQLAHIFFIIFKLEIFIYSIITKDINLLIFIISWVTIWFRLLQTT